MHIHVEASHEEGNNKTARRTVLTEKDAWDTCYWQRRQRQRPGKKSPPSEKTMTWARWVYGGATVDTQKSITWIGKRVKITTVRHSLISFQDDYPAVIAFRRWVSPRWFHMSLNSSESRVSPEKDPIQWLQNSRFDSSNHKMSKPWQPSKYLALVLTVSFTI